VDLLISCSPDEPGAGVGSATKGNDAGVATGTGATGSVIGFVSQVQAKGAAQWTQQQPLQTAVMEAHSRSGAFLAHCHARYLSDFDGELPRRLGHHRIWELLLSNIYLAFQVPRGERTRTASPGLSGARERLPRL